MDIPYNMLLAAKARREEIFTVAVATLIFRAMRCGGSSGQLRTYWSNCDKLWKYIRMTSVI